MKLQHILFFIIFFLASSNLQVTITEAAEMSFTSKCSANALQSCYIVAEGEITRESPVKFREFIKNGYEGYQILLNSSGGNLLAGLEIGRLIRSQELQAHVGRWNYLEPYEDPIYDVTCESACAYAFLGGITRDIKTDQSIGFHQFSINSDIILPNEVGLTSGQRISAIIITYLVEMGIDARMFGLASETAPKEMLFPSRKQLQKFNVILQRGYSSFVLEPLKDGIIAKSYRLTDSSPYDRAVGLNAFCKNGLPRFVILTAGGIIHEEYSIPFSGAGIRYSDNEISETEIEEQSISMWATKSNGNIELIISKKEIRKIIKSKSLAVYFNAPSVAGGVYGVFKDLTHLDKLMLGSAFKHCIE